MKLKRLTIVAIVFLFLYGCASVPLKRQVQALYLTKATAETIKDTAIRLHNLGILKDEDYNRVKTLYNEARKLNDKIIDIMIESIDKEEPVTENEKYIRLVNEFNEISKALINISLELGLIKEKDLVIAGGGIVE